MCQYTECTKIEPTNFNAVKQYKSREVMTLLCNEWLNFLKCKFRLIYEQDAQSKKDKMGISSRIILQHILLRNPCPP